RIRASCEVEGLEVPIRDVREARNADGRAPRVELADEPVEEPRQLLLVVVAEAGVTDELGMAAASRVERRQAAGKRLEERVRARVVQARRHVDVLTAQHLGELRGGQR